MFYNVHVVDCNGMSLAMLCCHLVEVLKAPIKGSACQTKFGRSGLDVNVIT